ncbi:MAG: ABC transporter type 1, transmembrane domain-containing protein [Linnemannia gamsii]|nr:MAG: ABC transporter type 1, transmembrane domain-containing protein [Linnemannia gamsii]
MTSLVQLIEPSLPLAYSLVSALVLVHLSRKPVHLDQYESLRDSPEDDQDGSTDPTATTTTALDNAQARYQARRASGFSLHLARSVVTAGQLGLALFSLIRFHLADQDSLLGRSSSSDAYYSLFGDSVRVVSWVYALALSLMYLIRPAKASQFWIRLQLDLFYFLTTILSTTQLARSDALTLPMTEWSPRLKVETYIWLTGALLIWISLLTLPYMPLSSERKLKHDEIARPAPLEYASSLYSQLTFSWINPLVYLGYKRPLQDTDLPFLEVIDESHTTVQQFKLNQKSTFYRSLFNAIKYEVLLQHIYCTPALLLPLVAPYCLNKIVKYIECEECGAPTFENYIWVFALLASTLLESIALQATCHAGRRIFVHVTSICNTAVFEKSIRRKDVSAAAAGGAKDAKEKSESNDEDSDDATKPINISNLIAVDIKKMEDTFCYIYEFYGFPIQFSMATLQLYYLLGRTALIGAAFMLITLPIPALLFSAVMKLFQNIMNTKDTRMDALNEMLSAIRIVKFFGWEGKFVEKITAARENELAQTRKSYIRMALAETVWFIVPLLNVVVLILTYTKYYGLELSASILFTTLSLFVIMRNSLNNMPWVFQNAMRASISLKRINRFLQEDDIVRDTTITKLDTKAARNSSSSGLISSQKQQPVVGFVNATFSWPNKEVEKVPAKIAAEKESSWFQKVKSKFSKKNIVLEDTPTIIAAEPEAVQERFQLKDLSIDFPVGKLALIVGPTGAGKTALLLALLGELDRVEGQMFLPRLDYNDRRSSTLGSGIAYVSQTAWLQNTTIRDNILFGKKFDQDLYDAVVEGCALVTDFEILESGDMTEIGEQGITLSGGQKQRVSLARAIYSDARVLLLDDCLSAVDTHTGKHLFGTLNGPLVEGRTILMATHQVQLTLNSADLVVVLEKGRVVGAGTPEQAVTLGWVDNVSLTAPASDNDSEISTLDGDEEDTVKKVKDSVAKKDAVKLTEDEKKNEGAVSWRVYKVYWNASGGFFVWATVIGLLAMNQALDMGQNLWFAHWTNQMSSSTGAMLMSTYRTVASENLQVSIRNAFTPKNGDEYGAVTMAVFGKGTPASVNIEFYLGVYVLLSFCTTLFYGLASFYIMVVPSIRGSRVLHEQLLRKVARAKVRFFDTTPMGRIVNRFSADITSIDDNVGRAFHHFLITALTVIGIVIIISSNMPKFIIAAVFIVAMYMVIAMLYVPVSRDLKRLNSNSRSPILNHFSETLNGLITIRAYGFEDRFLAKNLVTLDNNNRTFLLLWSSNRWLHWRVDATGALVSFSTAMLILQNHGNIEPGYAAMSMSYSLMFTMMVVWMIRIYADIQINLNSVERVVEYMDLEEEPPAIIEGSRPPAEWPYAGEISIDHLTMRYAPDTPDVIKDISFTIKAGEKVGVVGRTGSGKSTFAISLFRFMDPVKGSITIDGIDISKIGLQDLRSKLTIIPQDPILFKGTLRSNLDPFGELEDVDLWEALRRSHLIPASSTQPTTTNAATAVNASATTSAKASSSSTANDAASVKSASTGSTTKDTPEIVDPSKITLDTSVKENGSNFSQGQRQLISLARALVRKSKIIIMDEATASVDFDTDLKIQTTIREEMADATILTIAHRIRTIADFDRVLVMNAGEVAEFDKPLTLMRKEGGLFRSMCERSSELDALVAIAEAKEQRDAQAL